MKSILFAIRYSLLAFFILPQSLIQASQDIDTDIEKYILNKARIGNRAIMERLLDNPMVPSQITNDRHHTSLLCAIAHGGQDNNILASLLSSSDSKKELQDTVLISAVKENDIERIITILPYSDINAKNKEGHTAITLAARQKKPKIVALFLCSLKIKLEPKEKYHTTFIDKTASSLVKGYIKDVYPPQKHSHHILVTILYFFVGYRIKMC